MAEDIQVVATLRAIDQGFTKAFQNASASASALQGQVGGVNKSLVAAGAIIGGAGFALYKMGKDSFDAAARVSELNVAIGAIGKSTGIGAENIRKAAKAVRDNGIEMAAAQQMAIEFAQGNINMAQAADVARVAQDLAVISQKNSTDTATILTRAIKTGNSMLLKSAGVSRQASEGYNDYAREIGKTANTLNAMERQQAIVNLILDEGKKVAGVYEAAMQEPGKVIRSFPRILNDMQIAFGSALLTGFGPMIKAAYDLTSAFSKTLREGGALYPVIQQVTIVLKALFTPFAEGLKSLTGFVKGLKASEDAFAGVGKKVAKLTPMILAVATGLSTLAGKSLLSAVGLGKFATALNPLMAGIVVLVALNPKLRESFARLADAIMPLIPMFMSIGSSIASAAQVVIDNVASIVDVFTGPLVGVVSLVANGFKLIAGAMIAMGPVLEVLIVLMGVKFVASMIMAKIAAAQTAVALGTASGAQMFFARTTAVTTAAIDMFAMRATFGASAMGVFKMMVVQGFAAIKGAVLSFMSTMGPMLAMTAVLYGVMKVFQAYSDRNKQVEERSKELTVAIKEQIVALGKNKDALVAFLSSTDAVSKMLTTTGEDGEKLTSALHFLNKETSDALPVLTAMKDDLYGTVQAMAAANGASEKDAKTIAYLVSEYDDLGTILGSVPEGYAEMATQLEELNDQAEKTSMQDFINAQLGAIISLGKEEAQIVKTAREMAEKDRITKGAAKTDAYYHAILEDVTTKLGQMADVTKDVAVSGSKAALATKSMVQRLQELKAAADDGKFSVEEMLKAMYGIEAFEGVTAAKQFMGMREAMTDLIGAVDNSKGSFDALTKSGFSLFEQIGANAAGMRNLGKSEEEVQAMQTILIGSFIDAAKKAGFTDEKVNELMGTLGLLGKMRTVVTIDADISAVFAKLALLAAAMKATMAAGGGLDRSQMRQFEALEVTIVALRKESEALKTLGKSFVPVINLTKQNEAANKALEKAKAKLIKQIEEKFNKAIDAETAKLDILKGKLEAMTSAVNDAMKGGYNFANALTVAQTAADEYNEKLQELRDNQIAYGESVTSAISDVLSMGDALSKQAEAADDLKQAQEDMVSVQAEVNELTQAFDEAVAAYATARGRKARREALEDIQKAAMDLVPAQEKLAEATTKTNEAQEKQISFLGQLRKQFEQAKSFAGQLQQLIDAGLSKEAMQQIVEAGAVTGSQMAKELIDGGSDAIKETNQLFKDIGVMAKKTGANLADGFFSIGENVGADFIAALASQAEKAKVFADKVKQLVKMGLSPAAIQEVLSAGVEAGTQIAQALIDGGTDAINQSNAIIKELDALATDLNKLLNDKFFAVGISLGEQIVAGLKKALENFQDLAPDMSLEDLKKTLEETDKTIATIIEKYQPVVPVEPVVQIPQTGQLPETAVIRDIVANQLANLAPAAAVQGITPEALLDQLNERRGFVPSYDLGGGGGGGGGIGGGFNEMFAYAKGGVAQTPQLAMIAEKGPEAVLPMDLLRNMGGSATPTSINLTVNAGVGTDGRTVGDAIVNELVKWTRRNGNLPVTTN